VLFNAVTGSLAWTGLLTTALYPMLLVAATILWVTFRHPGSVSALRIRSARATRDVVFGAWSGTGLYLIVAFAVAPLLFFLISALAGRPVRPPRQEVLPQAADAAQIAIAAVSVTVLAPIGEEIFFRGFLFSGIRSRLGFWASAAISGALFAVSHAILLLMPLLFVVGVGLAWVFERRGSLVPAIAAHMAFNVIGYTFIVMMNS
jgi:membrane protease YdiL (CAAX protease family)